MSDTCPPRILYLEDDRALTRLVGRCLERSGYEVEFAHDGAQGLAMFTAGDYDLMALDFDLPGYDGLEIIRRLVPLEQFPPIIMVTACDDHSVAVEALKLGVADYVFKDAQGSYLGLLPLVIRQALDQRRLEGEKRKAEEALRLSEEKFRAVVNNIAMGISVINRSMEITYLNQQMRTWFPRIDPSQKPLCYKAFREPADDAVCPNCPTARTFADGQVHEAVIETPCDGQWKSYRVVSSPIRDEQSQVIAAIELVEDITQRKRMEASLAQTQKMEAVGQLAAGIAHEINTPIQYIGDNTRFLDEAFQNLGDVLPALQRLLEACKSGEADDALLEEIDNFLDQSDVAFFVEEVPKAVQESLDGVDRVARIVRAVKEFAHPGTADEQAIDLNRAVDNALTLAHNEWKYVAEVLTSFDPNLPPVHCFPSGVNQVVLNLVVNAAQAIAEVIGQRPEQKGTITVSTRRDGDWVEITVQDTGGGIPSEIHSKIFNPFFTTKDIGQGTGQGLSIAHAIVVEKHGGTILFQTDVGHGTTFVVRLPIAGLPALGCSDDSPTPHSTEPRKV